MRGWFCFMDRRLNGPTRPSTPTWGQTFYISAFAFFIILALGQILVWRTF